jgi:hypothetical protein
MSDRLAHQYRKLLSLETIQSNLSQITCLEKLSYVKYILFRDKKPGPKKVDMALAKLSTSMLKQMKPKKMPVHIHPNKHKNRPTQHFQPPQSRRRSNPARLD